MLQKYSSDPLHIFCKIQQSAFVLNNKKKINTCGFIFKIKGYQNKYKCGHLLVHKITIKIFNPSFASSIAPSYVLRFLIGPKTISFIKALVTSNCVTILLNLDENRLVFMHLTHPSEIATLKKPERNLRK